MKFSRSPPYYSRITQLTMRLEGETSPDSGAVAIINPSGPSAEYASRGLARYP